MGGRGAQGLGVQGLGIQVGQALTSHESKFSQVSDPDSQKCGFEVVDSALAKSRQLARPPVLAVDWGAET